MSVNYLIFVIVLSLVVYRVARFIVLDSLIDGTRENITVWLGHRSHRWWHKLLELIGCPFCVTIWISAFTLIAYRIFVDDFPIPVFTWLAVAAGALIPWRIIDWEEDD